MDEKQRPGTVEGIRTLMLHPTAFWAMQSGDHQIMIESLLDAIDAQAERIKALEAESVSTLMTIIADGDRDIRKETATAIAREARGMSMRWYGRWITLPDLETICRAHGAVGVGGET